MSLYVVFPAFMALIVFLALRPWQKILIAFVVMSNCFDLAPQIVYGFLTWDYGAVLFLIAGVQLFFRKNTVQLENGSAVLYVLAGFTAWLVICLIYSLLIYKYPLVDTLKTSRHWIIGYLSVFIFLKLYLVDSDALGNILRWLYNLTFVLLAVALVQLAIGQQILFGLSKEYVEATRYLPIFLPVVLVLSWHIAARFLAGESVKIHEFVYGGLALTVTALTYTRGIYVAVCLTFALMVALLALNRQINIGKTSVFAFSGLIVVVGIVTAGLGDRVIGRASSALDILISGKVARGTVDADTFTGRLRLAQERIAMVYDYNPLVGYGYLHERNVPLTMRNKLKYGSIDRSPEMTAKYQLGYPYKLTLYSPDSGWGNIALVSGLAGFAIFLTFMGVFVLSYRGKRYRSSPVRYLRLAMYLQTIYLLVLMFISNTFTYHIQFPAFMLAGYIYLSMLKTDHAEPA